jgi:dihydrodiol dehydrogenase / D-xylose 1-dehydrogenase (NADP)
MEPETGEIDFTLKWGIVSSGAICHDFCTALRNLNSPYHVIEAVAARNFSDAKKFADDFKITKAYGSYDELYQDNDVNIVYIGSINTTHKENCLKAINAGKHVLCEKPMVLNQQDQEEVFKAAKENHVFFMEALWTRFFPIVDKLRGHLHKNSIGEVKFFGSSFFLPIKDVPRIREKDLGGGALYE